jgi:hypothetical protein
MLIEEIKRQNKPYGLYFRDITNGFTTTSRAGLQAFSVVPVIVYRVYADGRPDELVRGADIVGTPLASFAKILATGDKPEVFNGYCGAESGSMPVSAVSPAILVSEIEIEKKAKANDRPPLLPEPELRKRGRIVKNRWLTGGSACPTSRQSDRRLAVNCRADAGCGRGAGGLGGGCPARRTRCWRPCATKSRARASSPSPTWMPRTSFST